MQYTVCCVPVSPLRAEPSHKSEMVSQHLFGEKSVVIETGVIIRITVGKNFVKI